MAINSNKLETVISKIDEETIALMNFEFPHVRKIHNRFFSSNRNAILTSSSSARF